MIQCVISLEDIVELLSNSDEGCPATEFLQLLGPHVGAGGADASEDVLRRGLHVSPILHLNRLTLRRPGGERERIVGVADTPSHTHL